LNSVPGVELREMYPSERWTICCGAGGGVRTAFTKLAQTMGAGRVKQAEATGADFLVSGCPFCETNLDDAIKSMGSPMIIKNITTIVTDHM